MTRRLSRIVIVGGGTSGWMTAAALAAGAPRPLDIVLVESDDIGTIGVGEATVPNIRAFNRWLGIDEAEFLRETAGTLKLGIAFVGWGQGNQGYFHPFGAYGGPYRGATGYNLWRRLAGRGDAGTLDDYNLASRMAAEGRFCHPGPRPGGPPDGPLSTFDYAYQFDASLYARYLRRHAERRGVTRVEGTVIAANLAPDGSIARVRLADGRTEAADVFIDCSGFRALLLGEALGVDFEDWSDLLPVDRAWAVPTGRADRLDPFTTATARDAGWQWRIPLQHRTGNGYVFSSRFTTEAAARETLLRHLDGPPLRDPVLLRFRTGVRRKLWHRNCVAIGLAGGFLEPLESTAINFVQTGITRFLDLLPGKDAVPALEKEYNHLMRAHYEEVRDFILLHYILTSRPGEALWDHMAALVPPAALARRIALFRDNGYTLSTPDDAYQPLSWIAILHGSGVVPARGNPLAEKVPDAELRHVMATRRATIAQILPHIPAHEQFLTATRSRSHPG